MDNSRQTLESMNQAIWYNQWTVQLFETFLKEDILEIGCGIGNFTKALIHYGRVYAIDIENKYIKETKRQVFKKAQVGYGDIEKGKYFFGKKSFDSIVCINVLEHIQDDYKALMNIRNLLKPSGYLIVLVPAHKFLYGSIDKAIGHYRRYEKTQLLAYLTELNFKAIFAKKINFFGALGWYISGKILRDNTVRDTKLRLFNTIAPLILPLEEKLEPPIGTSLLFVAKRL